MSTSDDAADTATVPAAVPEKRRRGRPPKPGEKKRVNLDLPASLVDILIEDADGDGVPRCDRVAEILGAHYGDGRRRPRQNGRAVMPTASLPGKAEEPAWRLTYGLIPGQTWLRLELNCRNPVVGATTSL